jgi:hypothetical protein
MKTVLKLAVVAAVLFAAYRVGDAYWDYYQFEDAVKDAAQFTDRNHASELPGKILDLAQKMEIPLDPDNLSVTRDQRHVTVDASYVRTVEFLPRLKRDWQFDVHVSVISMN